MIARRGHGLLFALRLGILLMLAAGASVLYHRYHLSPEQEDLIRYVEIEVAALQRVEGPIADRLAALLADRSRPAPVLRKQLVDELIPDLVHLRQLSEAPLRAARTEPTRGLAREYSAVIDQFIDVCRTALRVMDDPKLDGKSALLRIGQSLGAALKGQRGWEAHVREQSKALRLSR